MTGAANDFLTGLPPSASRPFPQDLGVPLFWPTQSDVSWQRQLGGYNLIGVGCAGNWAQSVAV